ncbi:AAA family ATPase [Brevundimonas sp. VNH65]|uniref:AAA family ATPase n=1 Tax=Brevundimonas sp. VNH65 TaxID=3400917 RepID=UPI003BFCEB89
MAEEVGAPLPNKIKGLSGLTPYGATLAAKGEIPPLANPAVDLLAELLGMTGPPETRNAAPAGPRNGVAISQEGGEPQSEIYDLLGDLSSSDAGELSALDRPLQISRFDGASLIRATRLTRSLRQLADEAHTWPRRNVSPGATVEERDAIKRTLPLLKLATFKAKRSDDDLLTLDGVEGDYDGKRGLMTVAEAMERLAASRIAALIYTSPNHTEEAPRWRVIVPTSRPVSPAEHGDLVARLNGALGGILEPESFDRARGYFYGALSDRAAPTTYLIDGRPIDLAHELPRLDRRGLPPGEAEPDDLLADLGMSGPADEDDDDLAALIPFDVDGGIRDALQHIPADDRDDWLRIGMALHHAAEGSEEGFEVWSKWSRQSDKFNARDQRRTWDGFRLNRDASITIATVYDMAKAYRAAKAKPIEAPTRLTFLSPSECEAAPRRGYIVKGMLAPGDIGCIFGQPGAGKSLIAPHIGYAMAQGRAAFGMRTKPGEVFYVAAEDSHGMQGRVAALKLRHGDAPGFTVVDGVSDLLADDSPDLAALIEAVEARRPSLVFLDTLAMAFPGLEENSAEGMGRVVSVARSLAQWGAAVVLIHHSTKAEGRTPRGHSLLNGALDMAMHVERDESGIVRGVLTKNRNGSCDRDVAFLIDTEHLGEDEDGDTVTAALVDELPAGAAPKPEKASPAKVMLRILDRLADSSGPSPVWVSEDEWRAACAADRGVSGSENVESRKRCVRRLIERLSGDMQIEFRDGQVRRFGEWSGDGLDGSESAS